MINGMRQMHSDIMRGFDLSMRLRSILRHREKRKGRAKGCDHQRYPNAHFIRAGLTFLTTVTHPDPPAPPKR